MVKIIKYWRPGCSPCVAQSKVLDQLKEQINFELEEINVYDLEREKVVEMGIRGVPYMVILKDSETIHKQTGLMSLEKLMQICQ